MRHHGITALVVVAIMIGLSAAYAPQAPSTAKQATVAGVALAADCSDPTVCTPTPTDVPTDTPTDTPTSTPTPDLTGTAAAQTATEQAVEAQQTITAEQTITAGQTATVVAQQTATAAAQQTATVAANIATTIAFKQTAESGHATAAAQQTATAAAAQQTATAAAAQQTAAAAAQQTSVAAQLAAQQTATAAARQTAAAQLAAQQTATAAAQQAAQQTAVAQQTIAAGGVPPTANPTAQPTPSAPAQQTAAAQQSAKATTQPATNVLIVVSGPAPTTAATSSAQHSNGGASPTPGPSSTPPSAQTASTGAPKSSKRTKSRGKGAPQTGPRLDVTLSPPLLQPGALEHVTVSYVAGAFVQAIIAFSNHRPATLLALANAHGRLTFTVRVPMDVMLHDGRALGRISVRAVSGTWRKLAALSPAVHPGAIARIAITYIPNAYVRANITFPGRPALSSLAVTDGHGRVTFTAPGPRTVAPHHGSAATQVVLSALSDERHAQATRAITVSDMVVSVAGSVIKSCMQTQTVQVSYRPDVPLTVVLTFPNNHRLPLSVQTDGQGIATLHVRVRYLRAQTPVRIGVQAIDARRGFHRSEQLTTIIPLPRQCMQ